MHWRQKDRRAFTQKEVGTDGSCLSSSTVQIFSMLQGKWRFFHEIKQVHTVLGRDILSERGGELPVTGVVKVSQGAGWDAGHRAAVSSQS